MGKRKTIVPKEELYQKYIVENMSRKECATFFNVSDSFIKEKVKQYNLVKTQNKISDCISKSQKIFLDKNVLYDLYIEKNLSMLECARELNVSINIIKNRLKDYGIKKPKDKFKEIHKNHINITSKTLTKRTETLLNKYGVDNISKLNSVKVKKEQTTENHFGVKNPFMSDKIKEKIEDKVREKYGVNYACMRNECRKYSGNNSKPNKDFANLLKLNNISYEREFAIENYSYDFKVGKYLFEIDPTIFHNSNFAPIGKPKDKFYHLNKSKVAKNNNYYCIHVFDWDDKEKIVNLYLKDKERIYARNCITKEPSKADTVMFLNENHLQNYAKDSIRIGLYYKNELVSIMTFGKPRYNKKYDYELIRFCSNKNVVGGARKIFKHFIEKYNPKSVISYCDLAKFDGKIYKELGFKSINNPAPSKHWYNTKTKQHITDNLLRQKGFDKLFKTNYGKGTSNEKLMLENGFLGVYDCGQVSYVWETK